MPVMPKAVGRLPAYATASFRADVAGHTKQQHDQVKVASSSEKANDTTMTKAGDSTTQCRVCGARVYEMEKLVADNHAYHKKCFKCCKCDRVLRVGNYASMDAQIFCKPHFVECFKQSGNYEEGFGKEKLSNRSSPPDKKANDEKENIPATDDQHAHEKQTNIESKATLGSTSSAEVAAPVAVAVVAEQDSQSVSNLNPTEFTLALEEKKRKLLQAAQASTEKSKDRLLKPVPGKLRPPPEIVSPGQQSPVNSSSSSDITPAVRPRAGAVLQIAAAIATGSNQAAHPGTEHSAGGTATAVADAQVAVRQRLLDPSARRDQSRPISWCGEPASAVGDGSSGGGDHGDERKVHAVAAAATIVPGSLKMKMLDLEAAKEASRAAAAAQRLQRMEADARAAAEAAQAAQAAEAAAAAQGEGVPLPEPASASLHFAELATVKSKFESGEQPSARTQTAAREEVEQVRSAVGHRAAAIRSRFQKKTAGQAGLSAARSLPDLSPAGTDGDEADDIGCSLDDESLDVPAAPSAKNEETVPKPGQLKSILSKLQSIQDSAESKEKVRPRPLLITDVDRHNSSNSSGNAVDGVSNHSSETVPADAKFQEQPWPKKAKSLRDKFECKEEQPNDGQALQSPKRPKPINILAEIEAYEQHNKAMGMKVKYVVESKGAETAADTRAEPAGGSKDKQ